MAIVPIPGGTDAAQQLAMINKNFGELNTGSQTQLFYDAATGLPSISIGVQQDRSSAIKVAKAGYDVTTASNANLAFNSAFNHLKVVAIKNVSVSIAYVANPTPTANHSGSSTTAHSLGFTPAFVANIVMDSSAATQNGNSSTDNYPNPGQLTGWVGSHLTDYVKATVTVDGTNVYFRVMMDTAGFTNRTYTYTATVYLLQETFTA